MLSATTTRKAGPRHASALPPAPSETDLREPESNAAIGTARRPDAINRGWEQTRATAWRWDRKLELTGGDVLKRATDLLASGIALLLLSPVLGAIAVLIKWHDGGSVLFWQARVGRHGKVFRFPKFRSMVANAEQLKQDLKQQNNHGDSITFKMKEDPRITPIGRILRRFSLDELPQLWCVFVGDMSLVGPRPPVPSEVAQYRPRDRRRLEATPGLTCIWQVSGRGDLSFDEQVELDIEYIERRSFWLDLWLILCTVPAVISGRGAY